MTYKETLDYMFNQLPMFQRIGAAAYNKDLTRTIQFCEALGNPHNTFQSIHIGGTNGKGSTAHFMASVLQEYGLKTAVYCSPHYVDFRERMKINGHYIPQEYVVDFIGKNRELIEGLHLSFFEMTVGMAFQWFADQKVDIAVIEVGMGGRLDSTNVITPLLSVITNVSFDHTQFLGNTIREIAAEKAGIIKKHVPVVIGETHPESAPVFIDKACGSHAQIVFADQIYEITEVPGGAWEKSSSYYRIQRNGQVAFEKLELNSTGDYQKKNLATVLAAIDLLCNQAGLIVRKEKCITDGLRKVSKNTSFIGRWQYIRNKPLVICDSAHNEAGFRYLAEQIGKSSFRQLRFVFGTVSDKDMNKVMPYLPEKSQYYISGLSIPRGMDIDVLSSHFEEYRLSYKKYENICDAYLAALSESGDDDLILIGGSIFAVADFLTFYNENIESGE